MQYVDTDYAGGELSKEHRGEKLFVDKLLV